jgi:NADPH2:quinone reductase
VLSEEEEGLVARVVRFSQTGGPEVLRLFEETPADPGPGEVRLKVEAIGLNRAEVMFRSGAYLEAPQFPSRLGYEAAGVIDAVGPGAEGSGAEGSGAEGSGAEGLEIGDRVSTLPSFSMGKYGVYGDVAIVPARAALAYPANLSPEQAASIWMAYVTAWGALVHIGGVSAADAVLVTAAASSVGLAAIQVARDHGATVIATTRAADKRDRLLREGADHVVVGGGETLAESVLAITGGKGARLIFDPVGGPLMEELANAAAPGGTIIEYGFLSGAPAPYPAYPCVAKGLTLRGYVLFEIARNPGLLGECLAYVRKGLADGRLAPVIDRTFRLDEIVEAHRYMEASRQIGKIVALP